MCTDGEKELVRIERPGMAMPGLGKSHEMSTPWRGWYHAVATTYGTWLRGDPRGWRSRHHREHVEGDYNHPPPPGAYQFQFERSNESLKHEPVVLSAASRFVVCEALLEKLLALEKDVIVLAVASTHAHAVCRFANWSGGEYEPASEVPGLHNDNALQDGRDPVPRHVMGAAMKHASHVARQKSTKRPGPLWAKRAKFVPIENRRHQVAAVRYIQRHRNLEGAALWTMWQQQVLPMDQ